MKSPGGLIQFLTGAHLCSGLVEYLAKLGKLIGFALSGSPSHLALQDFPCVDDIAETFLSQGDRQCLMSDQTRRIYVFDE